jgi:parallel beta-helix repeat protein
MGKKTACVFLALLLVSTLQLVVRIPQVKPWNGTAYIHADRSIDPPTAPIQQNGNLYTLIGNIVSDGDGIVIEKGSMTFDGNGYTIQGNYGGNGLSLISISDATIRNTNVQGFYYGIFLAPASQNTISGNNITTNDIGIALVSSSDYNNIAGNNIEQNNVYGIYVDSSSNNNIYRNNFADNLQQVSTSYSTNIWDHGYLAGGNYWSDYSEPDFYSGPYQNETGSDGIGDVPYEIDVSNVDHYPLVGPYVGSHDIGLINVRASKTVVCQGCSANITVAIENYGSFAENLTVTAYANATAIQAQNVTLESWASAPLVFVWNSTEFGKGNYTISAYAWPVQDETTIADNTLEDGTVYVGTPGDVDGNRKVEIKDILMVVKAYGTNPQSLGWNPNLDINCDDKVDIKDVLITAKNYGKVDP